MPSITYQCSACSEQQVIQNPITQAPPEWVHCKECRGIADRLWEAPEFICDRADRDPDHVPEKFRVSERVRPESKAEGKRIEKAYARDLHDHKRKLAEAGGGALKQTHKIPSHLYHGKIRQTGDKSYWLDPKNRNKHTSCRVDNYGRGRRGKG